MKYSVTFRGKEYDVHAHSAVPLGTGVVDDYISQYIKEGSFYEEPVLSYLKDRYDLFDVVVDCGANIGNHSKFFTEVMGAEVWSFEPSEENYRLLVRNNPMGHNYQIALGSKKGRVGLEEFPHNMGMNRVVPGKSVEMAPLDKFDLIPDLIKIDVEGMEADVLAGALKTIKKYRPILLVEHNDLQALYHSARVLEGLHYRIEVFSKETWELFLYLPNDH